jgi:hypothetical protein
MAFLCDDFYPDIPAQSRTENPCVGRFLSDFGLQQGIVVSLRLNITVMYLHVVKLVNEISPSES